MIVVSVEGCHGSGKSELCRQFSADGFTVLDEGFLTMPSFNLHPQTLVMESIWISNWFERLLKIQQDHLAAGESMDKIFIADRSPYSAVYYAGKHGHLLEPVIRQQIEDLKTQANIHVFTVLVKVEKELLWERIQDRLIREPERAKYNEGSRDWMDVTNNWYGERAFDFVIENNSGSIQQVKKRLVAELCVQVNNFKDSLAEHHPDDHHFERLAAENLQGEVKC